MKTKQMNLFNKSFIYKLRIQLEYYYYRYLAPYRNAIICDDEPEKTKISQWVNSLPSFKSIVVLAKGPSANLVDKVPENLYVTTNKSYELISEFPFVYFLANAKYVFTYLKNGISNPTCYGVIFREEVSTGSMRVKEIASSINEYKQKYKRQQPEIFVTDFVKTGCFYDNYVELDSFIQVNLGRKLKQFNSGFGAIYLGYYIAAIKNIPMKIYGMDAGNGGLMHYDGTEMASPSVSSERTRLKLRNLLNDLARQNIIEVDNQSYFRSDQIS
jgi:hypothetical protein